MLIEIDSRCNLKCKTCPRHIRKGKQGSMTMETFTECIDKLIPSTFENFIFTAGFGESMLNSNFFDMIRYAKKKGCSIMMPTNATLINDDNIKYLRLIDTLQLSIDTLKDKDRRTQDPNDILSLLPKFRKYGINIWFNVTLGTSTSEELEDILNFGIYNDAFINLITPRPLKLPDDFLVSEMKFVASQSEKIKRQLRMFPNFFFDDTCRTFQKCNAIGKELAVAWNGDLYPCSAAFFMDYKFGNIKDYDNLDVFRFSKEYQSVAKGNHPVCNYCKEYDKIWNQTVKDSYEFTKLDALRDKHRGQRCFILGSGSSLTRERLCHLRDEITIGVNDVAKAKELFGFESDYLCLSDHSIFSKEEYRESVKNFSNTILISEFVPFTSIHFNDYKEFKAVVAEKKDQIIFVPWNNTSYQDLIRLENYNQISFNLVDGTHICGTVIQDLAIPLAAWLGVSEIYLLGCDCDTTSYYKDKREIEGKTYNNFTYNQYKFFKFKLKEVGIKIYNLSNSIRRTKCFQIVDS